MVFLFLSLLVLGVGPLLERFARGKPGLVSFVDGYVLVTIGGLVFLEILPGSLNLGGITALVAAMVGLLGPGLGERYLRAAARKTLDRLITLLLAVVGLAAHASLDGAALARPAGASGGSLALAVVLHRLPVAVVLWALVRPAFGIPIALFVLNVVAAATIMGYGVGEELRDALAGPVLGAFEALVAGSLIHVVFHAPHYAGIAIDGGTLEKHRRRSDALGSLAGVVTVAVMMSTHGDHASGGHEGHIHIVGVLGELALAMAPALLLAWVIAGFARAFEWERTLRSALSSRPGGFLKQVSSGLAIAVKSPVCTDCSLPVLAKRVRAGISPTVILILLVAAPGLSLDAIFLSVPLFGFPFAVAKVLGVLAVALLAAWLLGPRLHRADTASDAGSEEESPEVRSGPRLRVAADHAFEVVDRTAPWILFGTGVASGFWHVVDVGALAALPPIVQVPLFALAGAFINLGPAGCLPVLAVVVAMGASAGGAFAMCLTSPIAGVTTLVTLARQYGRSAVLMFLVTIVVLAAGLGLGVDALLDPSTRPVTEGLITEDTHAHEDSAHADDHAEGAGDGHAHEDHSHEGHAHDEHAHDHPAHGGEDVADRLKNRLSRISLVLVMILVLISFLRRGARGFFGQVFVTNEALDTRRKPHHHSY